MKLISSILFIVITLMTVSCEGGTDYSWKVRNLSSSEITVFEKDYLDSLIRETVIISGELKEINSYSKLGGTSTIFPANNFMTKLIVVNSIGDTSSKDCLDESNWSNLVVRTGKIPSSYSHEYVLEISETDF